MVNLRSLLKEPLLLDKPDLDDPITTDRIHRLLLAKKPFLHQLYSEYYRKFLKSLPEWNAKPVLVELGSGGGFLKELEPSVITSDVQALSGLAIRMSGTQMPFKDLSVHAFFLLDTFHHLPQIERFLAEAQRCLKQGGRIVMMEPSNTWWGNFIFRNFHHEPFKPQGGWEFDSTGPLSSANGALPWIVFSRDRLRFDREFPGLQVRRFKAHTPFRYLLSGGFSMRQLTPSFTFRLWTWFEWALTPISAIMGLFYWIEIEKIQALDRAPLPP